jgi:hypothetical protein
MSDDERHLDITERKEVPWLSVVFGFGPMLPFMLGAIAAWHMRGSERDVMIRLTILWGAVILTFLAGVRRGLSFRTPGGPRLVQILTMLLLFCLGTAALLAEWLDFIPAALILETAGFAALIVLDPIAARHEEVPLFFYRLRPAQLPFAVISLGSLIYLVTALQP